MRALVQVLLLLASGDAFVRDAVPPARLQAATRLAARDTDADYMSLIDIESYGRRCGIKLVSKATGPYLRIEAFAVGSDNEGSANLVGTGSGATEQLIGYCTAFVRPLPFNLLQLDTIQVKNRRQTLGFRREKWTVDGPGISFIMGSWALRWGWERGCRRAELLAVKDSELMHKILVRLYESFGFTTMREVGDVSSSVTDRLMWGAVGTLMTLDVESFFRQWTRRMRSEQGEEQV